MSQNMGFKETILSQRERVILWAPIFALLLVVAMEFTPFYQLESSNSDPRQLDGEDTMTIDFYDDRVIQHATSEDWLNDNQSDEKFEGDMEIVVQMDPSPDADDYLGQMMVEIDSKLSFWATLCSILLLLFLVGLKDRININRFINHETINGTILTVLSFGGLILLFSIMGYGADFSEESFGDSDDELGDMDEFEYNDGFWGSIYFEQEFDGEVIENSFTWGPYIGYLILLFFTITTLLGAIACFSTLLENQNIEQSPKWFVSNETPELISKMTSRLPSILIVTTVLFAICAAFTPWYHFEQTWEGEHFGGENPSTNTTHEFAWTLTPFFVIFDNQSGLEDMVEGERSTSYDSYSEHPELENIAKPLLELRWPLICLTLLCIITVTKLFSSRFSKALGGEEKGWNTLCLVAIIITISLATSTFDKEVLREAEDDLDDLSASYYLKPTFFGGEDSSYGQSYTIVTNGSFFSEEFSFYDIQITWGYSIGAVAASIAGAIGLFTIALIWAPLIVRHLNEMKVPNFDRSQLELWKGRPAIAVMTVVVLITSLGGGVGELVASSESSAPESLDKWDIQWDRTSGGDEGSLSMSDGETSVIEIDTNNFDLGNTTRMFFLIECEEGPAQSQFDSLDSVSWSIQAPQGVNTTGMTMSGEITCSTSTSQDSTSWWGDWESPEGEIYAQSEEEALAGFSWISLGDGIWEITLVADIGEDNSPFQDDDECNASWLIDFEGMDGIRAVIDEE